MTKFLEKYGISQSTVKVIAVISMLIDHVGAVLFPQYFIMRKIGRIAFPLYCFLIVEGYFHTRDKYKYALRLLAFAFISEIPFDLAFRKRWFYPYSNNVFITLLLGLAAIWAFDVIIKKSKYFVPIAIIVAACFAYCANRLHSDYGWFGVALIVVFYIFRDFKPLIILPFALLVFLYTGVYQGRLDHVENLCLIAYIPIFLYNGTKGKIRLKYVFYAFYPAHLLIIYLLYIFFFAA